MPITPDNNTKYITTQTHHTYSQKSDIWRQISDSYDGGVTYRDGNYLHKFTQRESTASYQERKKRAVYFNNVKPLTDLLTGFIFSRPALRTGFKNSDFIEYATPKEALNSFMQRVATNSLLYTTGILVDSPQFDTAAIQTEADRKAAGLRPFCVLYKPDKIRNFYIDGNGALKWILLDNSRVENSNPYEKSENITQYRLWTQEYFQDFTQTRAPGISGSFIASEPVAHNLGEVPFTFVNWAEKDTNVIQTTIFEDIALFDQAIYNYMSLADEMLAGGTFKFLFYPGEVPDSLLSQSFSNLAVIPWSDQTNHKPFFDGPSLSEIDPFLKTIDFLLTGILRKLGLNTDIEKGYSQSGTAKAFDFTKTRALLISGATALEKAERELFRFAGLWLGIDDGDVEVEYQKDFLGDEEREELAQMYEALTLPFDKIKEQAAKRISKMIFSNSLTDREIDEIDADIEAEISGENKMPEINIKNLAQQQKEQNNATTTGATTGNENN